MAVDMFIKIGDVKGESTDDKHKGEIDVLSWSWGASQAGTSGIGGGGGAGKVQLQDLTITKYIDKGSPTLFKMCCDGTHIASSILTVRKAGGSALEYLKITLDTAIVTSITTGGSGGQDRLTENITLNFAKIKMEYTPQTGKGAGEASVTQGWDVAANKAWQ
ncbi:MAG TPA: type VI secretion system tube protein Hcp [Polyangiaceae bacterium]|jgi:type VI secretion system secreted protein Hcp|nr:type VI secretion system tube protein Hcp [Polyangiaceae bacterium]